MKNQQHDIPQLATRLLQKIFIIVVVATYLIDTTLHLRSRTNDPRQFIELLLLFLIPVGYFIVSYVLNSRKKLILSSFFQSLISSIAAYAFWNTSVNLIQSLHRTYTANLKLYYAAAIMTGILLIAALLYLRTRKDW